MFMLWTIFFTTLSGGAKLIVFGLFAALYLVIQLCALKKLQNPNFWKRYNVVSFQQEIRNYKWFGVFFFGAALPYILSLFAYVVLKNL